VTYINFTISGVPYSRLKSRGKIAAPREWSEQVIAQTSGLPKVKEACALKVTFLLPPNKFPRDYPYGPDLDNLLKRLLDGLNQTIFSDTAGHDSCVILLNVMKTKVTSEKEAGAHIEILPVSVDSG
jgi:Holliday junction resolvase RusA-like endonuclease